MMPASFTGYVMGLLVQVMSVLDSFLDQMASAVVYGDGVGGGALSIFKSVTGCIGVFLAGAIIWHIMEGAVSYSKTWRFPWDNFKQAFLAAIIATFMIGARDVYFTAKTESSLKGASFYGISYSGMTAGLGTKALQPAMDALAAVDVPQAWAISVYQFNTSRRAAILGAISSQDPATAQTYQNRLNYAAGGGKTVGLDGSLNGDMMHRALSTGSLLWDTAKDLLPGGAMETALLSAIVNWIVGMCILIGVWICELIFVLFAARTILILAFYLKLASFLAILVLPPAIGTLYFPAIRDYGIRAIRQIVALMVVSGALSGCVQVVFNQQTVSIAMAEALRSAIGPVDGPVKQEDILMFKAVTDAHAAATLAGADATKASAMDITDTLFAGLTVEQFFGAALCAIKMMLMLGALLLVLSKLYEVLIGAFEGDFDPLLEGKKAAG